MLNKSGKDGNLILDPNDDVVSCRQETNYLNKTIYSSHTFLLLFFSLK